MRRKRDGTARRPRPADIPPVPTVRPEADASVAPELAEPVDDAVDDAVRRMVEAAYT